MAAPLVVGPASDSSVLPTVSADDDEAKRAIHAAAEAERERELQKEIEDRETNFWRLRNFTIPLFYFILGFALRYPTVALRVFMIRELVAEPHVQSLIAGVVMLLPFSLKIFFAFLSDGVPILGQRRKPYMIGGVLVAGGAWITLGMLESPGITSSSVLLFLSTLGIVWADTMVDTLVVERMRFEHGSKVGNMQTTCWMLRYGGMFLGILLGGWLLRYGEVKPQTLFISLGSVILITLFPFMFPLADEGMKDANGEEMEPPTFKENTERIWEAVQLNSIWQPMIFVYIWNILPNDGDAWVNFLMGPLRFSDDEYSYILAIGTASGAVGALLYKTCLKTTGLHIIFYSTIVVSTILSCIPFILITRANVEWGIPDFAFAMGNEVINDVAGFIMYMPVLIMCSKLCPDQVEGSVYALTCVVNNIGSQISMSFSSMLTHEFGITLKNFDNLWQLHLVVVLLMLVPLAFVHLTPNRPGEGNPDELRRRSETIRKQLNGRRTKRAALHHTNGFTHAAAAASPKPGAADAAEVGEVRLSGAVSTIDDTASPSTLASSPSSASAAAAADHSEDEEEGTAGTKSMLRQRTALAGTSTSTSSTDASATTSSSSDDDEEAAKKSRGCCSCCSSSSTEDHPDTDAELDEASITDEEWQKQEAKLETELADLVERLSQGTALPKSKLGGGIFLGVVFGSLVWSTTHASIRLSAL